MLWYRLVAHNVVVFIAFLMELDPRADATSLPQSGRLKA
jgi:hypothetical protein